MASGGTVLKTKNQPSAEIRVTPLRIPDISVVPKTLLIRSYVFNPFAVNVAQKKAAGEYQDMMAAEGDYTGSLSMTFRAGEVELSLDYGSISIGADLGDYHYVGSIEINPRETGWRVTPRQIEVYVSARNDENYYTQLKDYLYLEEGGKIILRMRKPEGARYVKVHCTFDDRDSYNNYVNLSTLSNEARELITVNYLTRERLEEYSYDAKGNRTQRLTNHDGRIETNPYTYYPNSDRIKTDGTYAYRYDANGNRTGKGTHYTDNGTDIEYSALEGEVWTYRYDPFNRLMEVKKSYEGTENLELAASYSYDHRSLRVQRTDREGISTCYAYSPQGKLLYEDREGEITDYIYLGNKLAAKRTAGRTLWYSTDHLGSTVMLTDDSGEIVWSEGYTAFGEASGKTGYEISESGRYTGKDYDEAAGLYYYNARWYDAALGRFITEDPARDGANWYAYVRNNPLRYVDPTGLRINSVQGSYYQQAEVEHYWYKNGKKYNIYYKETGYATIIMGTGTDTIGEIGCKLLAYTRIANAINSTVLGTLSGTFCISALTQNLLNPGEMNSLINKVEQYTNQNNLNAENIRVILEAATNKEIEITTITARVNGKDDDLIEIIKARAKSQDEGVYIVAAISTQGSDGKRYTHFLNVVGVDSTGNIILLDTSNRDRVTLGEGEYIEKLEIVSVVNRTPITSGGNQQFTKE